ncbi:MAG TPA: DUF6600 domain-containing protein [Thermoanaerobaculia bacterium]|nr:DUF6600 domain-containing protein [Thermoanaerobaculia bacterium]
MRALKTAILTVLAIAAGGGCLSSQPPPPGQPYEPPPPAYNPPPDYNAPPSYPPDGAPPPNPDQGSYDQGYGDQPAPGPGGEIDVSFFYDSLAPYGEWVESADYGWVWVPRVQYGWRPYTDGHWIYTEDGWAWVANERWGWGPFHYGRWYDDDQYGWAWVPGPVWAPAWVSWQAGAGYVGWAPLPPRIGFRIGIGLELGGLDLRVAIPAHWYSFVPEHQILAPRVADVVVPPARNVTIIHNTINITNYTVVSNRVVNRGVPVEHVQQVIGRPIQPLRIASVPTPAAAHAVAGNQVTFFRPPVRTAQTAQAPPPIRSVRPETGGQPQPPQRSQPAPTRPSDNTQAQPPRTARPESAPGAAAQGPAAAAAVPRPPRYTPRETTAEQLNQRHQSEQQALQAYQQSERQRLQQLHQQDLASRQEQAQRDAAAKQHADELQALQSQHQHQQQALQGRQQRERQAVQSQPPAKQQQPPPQRKPPPPADKRPPQNPPPAGPPAG